ncbi:MAG: alpha/beta fold hydrolase [Brevundimonas sp.]
MAAGFEYYRAVPTNIVQNADAAAHPLTMPILALGGSKATGDGLLRALVATGSPGVEGGTLEGCGHYFAEECPEVLTERLLAFLTGDDEAVSGGPGSSQ